MKLKANESTNDVLNFAFQFSLLVMWKSEVHLKLRGVTKSDDLPRCIHLQDWQRQYSRQPQTTERNSLNRWVRSWGIYAWLLLVYRVRYVRKIRWCKFQQENLEATVLSGDSTCPTARRKGLSQRPQCEESPEISRLKLAQLVFKATFKRNLDSIDSTNSAAIQQVHLGQSNLSVLLWLELQNVLMIWFAVSRAWAWKTFRKTLKDIGNGVYSSETPSSFRFDGKTSVSRFHFRGAPGRSIRTILATAEVMKWWPAVTSGEIFIFNQ